MFSFVLVLVHVLYFIMVFHFIAFADSSSPLGDISALFLFVYSLFSSLPKICARPSRVIDHISLLPICLCHTFRPRYPRPVHVDSSIHPLFMIRDNSLAIHYTLSSVFLAAYHASTHSPSVAIRYCSNIQRSFRHHSAHPRSPCIDLPPDKRRRSSTQNYHQRFVCNLHDRAFPMTHPNIRISSLHEFHPTRTSYLAWPIYRCSIPAHWSHTLI